MADGHDEESDALDERLKLVDSKVNAKIFFHKDAMVEYMDMKGILSDITEEKKKVEQERHRAMVMQRVDNLAPVQVELMASKMELAVVKEELAVAREQLAQRNQELDEKDEELAALRVKLQKMEARNSNTEQQNGTGPDPVHLQPNPPWCNQDQCKRGKDHLEDLWTMVLMKIGILANWMVYLCLLWSRRKISMCKQDQ